MTNTEKHSLFTLLYGLVLIDNRVVKVEVDEFLAAVEDFLVSVDGNNMYQAKSVISTWFIQNYKDIRAEMKMADRDVFLLGHVEKLKFSEYRQAIFHMMQKIALADKEFHILEEQFLDKVSEIWGLNETY